MADTKISAMAAATALAGTEAIPGVQAGGNVKITPAQISTYLGTWSDYTPTITGYSGTPSYSSARYCLIGKMCFVNVMVVTGTSNSASTTITLPANAIRDQFFVVGAVTNNGVVQADPGRADLSAGSNIATIRLTLAGGSWTSSGTKIFSMSFAYETA